MRKTININKKIILAVVIIILLLIGYYIYYKNSNVYKEFEESSNLEELISYEIDEENNTNQESEQKEVTAGSEDKEENNEKIVVHITGEVKNWGVIELEKGSRVIDAVNIAGGFTDDADIDKVNLAYVLTDAIKIYIPSKNEEESVTTSREYITSDNGDNIVTGEENMKKSNNSIININNATQTELETLPGIGPSIALKIISYREENGNFFNIEDIKNVSGIGENKFNNIKEFICI